MERRSRVHACFEDVVPALEHLRRKGWRQTVVSNHVPEFDRIVDALGIGGFFGAVVSSGINAD